MRKKQPVPFLLLSLLWVGVNSGRAQTCADSSNSRTLPSITAVDTTEHTGSGLHSFSLTTVAKCTYAHGNTSTCDVTCNVDPVGATTINRIGNFVVVETGALTTAGNHDVSGNWLTGVSQGFGSGTTCTGQMAAGAANCGTLGLKCILGVTVTGGGASVSAESGSTVIWRSPTASVPVTCAAVADPQATPTPPPPPPPSGCTAPPGSHFRSDQTGDDTDPSNCSPIIVDLTGDGFFLTSAANGVKFDIANTGIPLQIAWTANANSAFLVLDRNGNGVINSGAELFGNFTPQPVSAHPNGFLALAQYDSNGDGVIDAKDPIYSQLRLWVDINHDGISQPGELHTLQEMGVYSISLDYSLSQRTDEFGNVFRYKAKINQGLNGEPDVGKKAYDVFFVTK
jgi:hypothetical protein